MPWEFRSEFLVFNNLLDQAAAEATSKITGGKLDVLINNAGLVSEVTAFKTLLD